MILVIDVGNTNIKYGVYDKDNLVASYRVASHINKTADEYGSVLLGLLKASDIKISQIKGIILSSVIPSLNYTICHMCEYFFKKKPLVVGPGVKTGLNIKADNPREVGADIIVNSISAYKKYGGPLVVIDFGTATTFDVISGKGELIGVIIAPGVKTALESLVNGTAQLPMIEIASPKSVLGKNTETAMQSGIVFGFAGLVENIIKKIKKELKVDTLLVVATGGMSKLIKNEVECINVLDKTLTLDGLKYIYSLNEQN